MEKEEEETLSTPGVIEKYQTAGKIANGNPDVTQKCSPSCSRRWLWVPRFMSFASGQTVRFTKNCQRSIIRSKSSKVLLSQPPFAPTSFAVTSPLLPKIQSTSRKEIFSTSSSEYMSMDSLPSSHTLLLFNQTRMLL